MSENTFNPLEINLQTQPLPTYIDENGAFKLNTPMLSSFDFDGLIPKFDGEISASAVKPGYMIQAVTGEYFPVISVEYDEDEMEDVPSGIVTINYLDDQGNITSVDYDQSDSVAVVYENWDEKSLGTQGWGITAGGNAIFTNVAVRGDLEANTLDVGGPDGITYDGTEVIIGASVTILGGLTIGDVSDYLNENNYATDDDLTDFITAPEVNTNVTSISGGVITTGRIKNSTYNGPVSGGGSFSTTGSQFNIDDGTIVTPAFRVDSSGNGYFKGDIGVISRVTNYSGSVYLTNNSIVDGGANFPALDLRYNYLGTFVGRGTIGFGMISSQPAFKLSSDGSVPMQIYPGGDLYISTSFGSVYITDNVSITGTVSGTNNLVLTNGDYANPSWLLSLAGSKITGAVNRATYANNLDSNVTGGALITGQTVTVNNVGTSTSSDLIRRDGSNNLKVTSSSSRKIKTDISSLNDMDVLGIEVVKFKYIPGYLDENDQRLDKVMPGFIVEQMYEVLPIAIDLDSNGDPYNWNDRILIPVMVKTIQDQQKLIEDLQNRMLQLESQLGG